jgi:hypothetical protein
MITKLYTLEEVLDIAEIDKKEGFKRGYQKGYRVGRAWFAKTYNAILDADEKLEDVLNTTKYTYPKKKKPIEK